jgi:hypothetical protein
MNDKSTGSTRKAAATHWKIKTSIVKECNEWKGQFIAVVNGIVGADVLNWPSELMIVLSIITGRARLQPQTLSASVTSAAVTLLVGIQDEGSERFGGRGNLT